MMQSDLIAFQGVATGILATAAYYRVKGEFSDRGIAVALLLVGVLAAGPGVLYHEDGTIRAGYALLLAVCLAASAFVYVRWRRSRT